MTNFEINCRVCNSLFGFRDQFELRSLFDIWFKLVLFLYRGLISRWVWSFSELLVVVCLLFENPQSRAITDNRNISSKKIMCEIWS